MSATVGDDRKSGFSSTAASSELSGFLCLAIEFERMTMGHLARDNRVAFWSVSYQPKIFTSTPPSTRYVDVLQMDLESLTGLFATTLSPDPNVRKTTELQIRKVCRRLSVWKKVDDLDQYY